MPLARALHVVDSCFIVGLLIATGCARVVEAPPLSTAAHPPPGIEDGEVSAAMEPIRPQLQSCCAWPDSGDSQTASFSATGRGGHSSSIGLVIDGRGEVVGTSAAGGTGASRERDCLEQTARMAHFPPTGRIATYANYWVQCGAFGERYSHVP